MARYGGMFEPKEVEDSPDPKIALDAKCEASCTKTMDAYMQCKERIEDKGKGECSGYYGDHVGCIDVCTTKGLFKQLV